MSFIIDPTIHMWFGLFMTLFTFGLFANDKVPLEVSSVVVLALLILFSTVFPIPDFSGHNIINATTLLAGFSNESLIAVLALLVVGAALIKTAALRPLTNILLMMRLSLIPLALAAIFLFVLIFSAFINNTPLVIIAIPILQALGARLGIHDSRIMIPLSFVAILGGMTTLVGSSTNLLVSSALVDLGYDGFSFFDFTVPGVMLALAGLIYIVFVLPFLLPKRTSLAGNLQNDNETFIAELYISDDSDLVGECLSEVGKLKKLLDMSIRMVQRDGRLILAPFESYEIQPQDILIVATKKEGLMQLLSSYPSTLLLETTMTSHTEELAPDQALNTQIEESQKSYPLKPARDDSQRDMDQNRVLCEVMIPPGSSLIGKTIREIRFEYRTGCKPLGLHRHASTVRRRLHQMRLEAGDVMLVTGYKNDVFALREDPEMVVLAGSRQDIPMKEKSSTALFIFMLMILLAATGTLPIVVAAVIAAVGMLLTRCLSLTQVMRAFDRQIFFLVGSALALGTFLQTTGGASFIAEKLLSFPVMETPFAAASGLFILVAIATNLLTNNACAIIFTPIAVSLALELGVDPMVFAMTVVFAANCSFASPIGYQTNLLVMGPGHYRFKDFMVAGVPLVLIMWFAYMALAKYYFGL